MDSECFPATDAKKQYFLSTQDLLDVPYESECWGFGTGRPTKWYKCSDLEAAALNKYGAEELAKKRAKRAKRNQKQRLKQEAAFKAEEELMKLQQGGENAAPNPTTSSVASKDLQDIRKAICRAFKPLITWDYLRTRNSPHGCNAVAHVPRVQQAEFAALIGRPSDPNLTSLVKTGAWYSADVEFSVVMGCHEAIMGKGGRYGCNRQLGIDPNSHLTVKFKPSDKTLSVTAYVRHEATFGYDY